MRAVSGTCAAAVGRRRHPRRALGELLRPVHGRVGPAQELVARGGVLGVDAMPTLPPAVIVAPSIAAGAASACSTCSAIVWAISRAGRTASGGRSATSTRNSSPPWRATRSVARVARSSRRAIWRSSWSPASMAVGVVDVLEVVQVDVEDGDLAPVPLGAREREVEVLGEHEPVRQAGQVVVVGQVGHPLIGQLAGGDVAPDLGGGDHPAARVDDRRHRQRHVHLGPVLAHPHRLEVLDRLAARGSAPAPPATRSGRPRGSTSEIRRPIASAAVWP